MNNHQNILFINKFLSFSIKWTKKKHKKIVFLFIIFFFFLISFGVKIITMALHMQSSWMHRNHFQFHFSNAKSFICGKCSFNDFYLMTQTLYTILKEMLYNWLLSFCFFFTFSHITLVPSPHQGSCLKNAKLLALKTQRFFQLALGLIFNISIFCQNNL